MEQEKEIKGKKLNFWFSIWIKPRETMRQILEKDSKGMIFLLVSIVGFLNVYGALSTSKVMARNFSWYIILLVSFVLGSLCGIIFLYIFSSLIKWTSIKDNGKASPNQIRASIAWSSIPIVWTAILIIPRHYLPIYSGISSELLYATIINLLDVMETVAALWSLIIFIITLSEVQEFSFWKAAKNYFLSILILIPCLALAIMGGFALIVYMSQVWNSYIYFQ